MNSKLFFNFLDQQWTEITKNVNDALVIIDDSAAECLHWHGGLNRMLSAGAYSVENFSPFVTADSKIQKVVFVLSSPLTNETRRTLTVVMRANRFKSCSIFTALPPRCHSEEQDPSIFHFLEKQIYSWMESRDTVSTVRHIPYFPCSIADNVFTMPNFSKNFAISSCGLIEMNIRRTEELSIKSLPDEMQLHLKNLAFSITSLLESFQIKGDFFSIGPLSHVLGSELESISHQQKKFYTSKASVVLIDRLLDLAGPLSQSYDTMLDKILLTLPHLSGHTFDVGVPMNDLAACKSSSFAFERPLLAPGCLAHRNSSLEESTLNSILFKKPRETLIDVNRSVIDCAGKEGISIDVNSRLTADVLRQRILAFKQKPKSILKFCGFLQQVLAVVQAIDYSAQNSVDNIAAIEKALLEYLATSPEEVLHNIMQMISEKEEMHYKMEDILIFLAFFYMLSGESDISNETAMQATLMEEFLQHEESKKLMSLFVDGEHNDEFVLNAVRTLFDVCKRLGTMRKRFKKYSTLFKSSNPAFPATYNSLLKQLLDDIFDTSITDIPDLEFHSAGLRDYIKTGFSLFMNVTKPQPRDNPVIFIIILGGVTAAEIKFIQETAAQNKGNQIFLGSTGVLTPHEVLKDLGLIVKDLTCEG